MKSIRRCARHSDLSGGSATGCTTRPVANGINFAFEDQLALAGALKYREADGQQPVERFMGELHANMEVVKQQHLIFLHENWLDKSRRRKRSHDRQADAAGLKIASRGLLDFKSPEAILHRPELMMHIFEESAAGGCL